MHFDIIIRYICRDMITEFHRADQMDVEAAFMTPVSQWDQLTGYKDGLAS